jgi:hypothetical protein
MTLKHCSPRSSDECRIAQGFCPLLKAVRRCSVRRYRGLDDFEPATDDSPGKHFVNGNARIPNYSGQALAYSGVRREGRGGSRQSLADPASVRFLGNHSESEQENGSNSPARLEQL